MKALVIAGARPNFPKVKPVLDALEATGWATVFVHTGQHYDAQLSDVFLDELGIRPPDEYLGVGSASHAEQTARIMQAFEPLVLAHRPDVVIVAGDVNSTVACALVTAKLGPRVAHVEAGLRSRDWAMPEEINRVVTDRLSDFLFAPSQDGADNLLGEGYRPDQVHVVGNVMIDSLLANLPRAEARFGEVADSARVERHGYALTTLHRPSNVDDEDTLGRLVGALAQIGESLPIVFPVHPRTRARLEHFGTPIPPSIRLVDPLGYLDFIAMEASARLVLTDSGGVQEETTALGVPCLTLRENTERPITVTHGTNTVVGTDPALILKHADAALRSAPGDRRRPDLWDGCAGERIATVLNDPAAWAIGRPTDC